MRTKLTRINGSIALIIPAHIVVGGQFDEECPVEIEFREGRIIVSKTHPARQGWSEAFSAYAGVADDEERLPDHLDSEAIDLIN